MEKHDLARLFEGKEQRRHGLAKRPIEEKLRAVVRLQQMAEPILRQRGRVVRCWRLEGRPH